MRKQAFDRKARILVVDDEPIVGSRLKDLLERDGYSVDSFTDGQAALNALVETEYDLVITDLKMEGVDGFRILEAAKASRPEPGVIIITGFADIGTADEARDAGAIGFIPKPFKTEEIRHAIERFMADFVTIS